MSNPLPVIGVPLGDPAGIGPEIAIKAAQNEEIRTIAKIKLIGSEEIVERTRKQFSLSLDGLDFHFIPDPGTGDFEFGKINAACGKAAYDAVHESSILAMKGLIDVVATTPINKESLRAAKIDTIGHTELFGKFTGTANPVTLFQTNELRVFFLTRHMSLIEACRWITYDTVLSGIINTFHSMMLLGIKDEGIPFAVAGLNPHNGEHGLFGIEEEEAIRPAVQKAQEMGIPVVGPVPADSVFYMARMGKFSAVLSLYHDQGHIATKTYDFEKTISLTLGMPFLRTSVDHGTAFDIAGKGIAQTVSMKQAIIIAAKYAELYKKNYRKYVVDEKEFTFIK